jgi:hypothetical protein
VAKIFICYSRQDSAFAEKLVGDLRSRNVDLFFDQQDIMPGDAWDTTVENALDSSPWLLVILSPDSVASENVMDEVGQALSSKKKVIPIMYRPCKVHYRIARLQRVDFTGSYDRAIDQLMAVIEGRRSLGPMTLAALQPSPQILARFGSLFNYRPAFLALAAAGPLVLGSGIYWASHHAPPGHPQDLRSVQAAILVQRGRLESGGKGSLRQLGAVGARCRTESEILCGCRAGRRGPGENGKPSEDGRPLGP